MIEKIKKITIDGMGTATEIFYETSSRGSKENEMLVYYHLRDVSQSTVAFDSRTNQNVVLPYKIVKRQRIVVVGEDLIMLNLDPLHARDIAVRESGVELDSDNN